mmetsp:Transcript_23490/g.67996  ORF Transcript_23490/g.67996 Transcript_23490/m.67996 type:complete len:544 (-) Transcript_23490:789-2420(-)
MSRKVIVSRRIRGNRRPQRLSTWSASLSSPATSSCTRCPSWLLRALSGHLSGDGPAAATAGAGVGDVEDALSAQRPGAPVIASYRWGCLMHLLHSGVPIRHLRQLADHLLAHVVERNPGALDPAEQRRVDLCHCGAHRGLRVQAVRAQGPALRGQARAPGPREAREAAGRVALVVGGGRAHARHHEVREEAKREDIGARRRGRRHSWPCEQLRGHPDRRAAQWLRCFRKQSREAEIQEGSLRDTGAVQVHLDVAAFDVPVDDRGLHGVQVHQRATDVEQNLGQRHLGFRPLRYRMDLVHELGHAAAVDEFENQRQFPALRVNRRAMEGNDVAVADPSEEPDFVAERSDELRAVPRSARAGRLDGDRGAPKSAHGDAAEAARAAEHGRVQNLQLGGADEPVLPDADLGDVLQGRPHGRLQALRRPAAAKPLDVVENPLGAERGGRAGLVRLGHEAVGHPRLAGLLVDRVEGVRHAGHLLGRMLHLANAQHELSRESLDGHDRELDAHLREGEVESEGHRLQLSGLGRLPQGRLVHAPVVGGHYL